MKIRRFHNLSRFIGMTDEKQIIIHMKKQMVILFWFFSIWAIAQTPEILFQQANTHFKNGKFELAIETYEKIIASGFTSPEVYYNMGNAYYKLNEIAPSIFYYEKALQMNPDYSDAQNNLQFAQRMAIDVVEPLPKTVIQKINESLIYPIHYNTWAILSVVLAMLTAFLFIAYFYSPSVERKKWFFVSSIVSIFLFLLVLTFGIKAKHYDKHNLPAIVFAKQVEVRAEPTPSSSTAFVLHEGAKVHIGQQEDTWYKIILADGKTGWIMANNIKQLK